MTLSELECRQNNIGSINSTFFPPTSLGVAVEGVATDCIAHWTVMEMGWPHFSASGALEAQVGDSSLEIGLHLDKREDGLAGSASMTGCSTVISIKKLEFSGGITSEILELFRGPIRTFVEKELDKVICTELGVLIDTNLTEALQNVDAQIVPYLNPRPPSPTRPVPPGMINLLDDPLVNFVAFAVDDLLGPLGLLSINKVVDRFTNNTGKVDLSRTELEDLGPTTFSFPISTLGTITLGITSLQMEGLNTWGAVDLEPISNYSLAIHTEMAEMDINATFFINVTTVLNDKWLYEEGKIILRLAHNDLRAATQLALREDVVNKLNPAQLIFPGCLAATLYDAELFQLFFNTSVRQLTIKALDGDLEKDLDDAINQILLLFTSSFGLAIPAFFNGFGDAPIKQAVNSLFLELMENKDSCPAPPIPTPNFSDVGSAAAFAGAGVVFLFIGGFMLFAQSKFKRKTKVEITENYHLLGLDDGDELPPLALDPNISVLVRYGVPVLLLLNIALFISSNTSVGANIYLVLQFGEHHIQTPSLFTFSLGNTVRDMWHAGVYPLALLIAILSGAWPYLKLLIMLYCWFIPTKFLSAKRRESMLMTVDNLGKWSLIDAFVLTLMVVAFRFEINYTLTSSGGAPDIPAVVNVFVEPEWGFYSFLGATMSSLALTHLVLAFHHQSSAPENQHLSDPDAKKEALCSHVFQIGASNVSCTPLGKGFIVILLIASANLIAYGAYLDSFNFKFEGAAGAALEILGNNPERSYSVISLGVEMPHSNPEPNSFGIRGIQFVYFAFVLVIPFAHLIILLVLWLISLKPQIQRRIFVVTEVLNAWSALEVFVVSIIAAILEIEQFVKFIIGDKCDQINPILKQYFDHELDGDDQCFDMSASLNAGCWTLFSACLIYLFAGNLVMRTCHGAIQQQALNYKASINYQENEDQLDQKKSVIASITNFFWLTRDAPKTHY